MQDGNFTRFSPPHYLQKINLPSKEECDDLFLVTYFFPFCLIWAQAPTEPTGTYSSPYVRLWTDYKSFSESHVLVALLLQQCLVVTLCLFSLAPRAQL